MEARRGGGGGGGTGGGGTAVTAPGGRASCAPLPGISSRYGQAIYFLGWLEQMYLLSSLSYSASPPL